MGIFSTLDLVALIGFVGAWICYALLVEFTPHGRLGLNARVDTYREQWMRYMLSREMRMVDMQIMAAQQNGTAFFRLHYFDCNRGRADAAAIERRDAAGSFLAAIRH